MKHLKELRQNKGVTQQHIADLLGISRGAYTNIENGKRQPAFDTVSTLADYFDVTVDYLLGRKENEKPAAISDGLSGGDISSIPESELDELLVELLVALDIDENLVRLLLDVDPADTERVKGYLEGLRATRK